MTHPHSSGSAVDDRALSRAMFLYGFAMFMLVYMVQPLLPRFVAEFSIAPAIASQALSAATMGMAACLIPASMFVDRFPPRSLLITGLLGCSLLSLAVVFTHSFSSFVVLRLVFGMLLSALPATALAFLARTVDPSRLGRSVGLYIAGNAMGGMSGRLMALALSEWMDWRQAFAVLGVLALGVTLHVGRVLSRMQLLHSSLGATAGGASGRLPWQRVQPLLTDKGLLALFALAFLLSGCIVSVYNYISFRLAAQPYEYGYQALCGIYALYVLGMLGSARAGRLADRFGKGAVLIWLPLLMAGGLWMSMADGQVMIIVGLAVITFGFFGAHSVASGWVSARAPADRALASSLYLTAYYLGASVLGTAAGSVWAAGRWPAVVAMNSAIIAMALLLSIFLRRLKPGQAAAALPGS
jgi:YNFM family putative membrane transporter